MTTIYDMASGTEYLGEELSCPQTVVVRAPAAPQSRIADHYRVAELQLVEAAPAAATVPLYPAGLDMSRLIDKLED